MIRNVLSTGCLWALSGV